RVGSPPNWANTPAITVPDARPPMLAAVATIDARALDLGPARSSSAAVPVAVTTPAARPLRSLANNNISTLWASRKPAVLAATTTSDTASRGRRPPRSDIGANTSSETTTPSAYTAKISVVVNGPKPMSCDQNTYSGIGSAPPSIASR